jgi:hypothetical protein
MPRILNRELVLFLAIYLKKNFTEIKTNNKNQLIFLYLRYSYIFLMRVK